METRAREEPKIDGRRKLLQSLEKSEEGYACHSQYQSVNRSELKQKTPSFYSSHSLQFFLFLS